MNFLFQIDLGSIEKMILLLAVLIFLVWLSILLNLWTSRRMIHSHLAFLIDQIRTLKGDAQQIKTAQRADKKRDYRIQKELASSRLRNKNGTFKKGVKRGR